MTRIIGLQIAIMEFVSSPQGFLITAITAGIMTIVVIWRAIVLHQRHEARLPMTGLDMAVWALLPLWQALVVLAILGWQYYGTHA